MVDKKARQPRADRHLSRFPSFNDLNLALAGATAAIGIVLFVLHKFGYDLAPYLGMPQ